MIEPIDLTNPPDVNPMPETAIVDANGSLTREWRYYLQAITASTNKLEQADLASIITLILESDAQTRLSPVSVMAGDNENKNRVDAVPINQVTSDGLEIALIQVVAQLQNQVKELEQWQLNTIN